MKQHLQNIFEQSVQQLANTEGVDLPQDYAVNIDRARNKQHGDYATNAALVLAKSFKLTPRELAGRLIGMLEQQGEIQSLDIAGPGFINIILEDEAKRRVVRTILEQAAGYGHSQAGNGKRIILEYVSANPTGPLHVGHGRGAAVGSSLANILQTQGYEVHQEYYVNDAGRQMHILAVSVLIQYWRLHGCAFPFPQNGYRGNYVIDIAKACKQAHGDRFVLDNLEAWLTELPADADQGGDKETYVDALIDRVKQSLTDADYRIIFQLALQEVLSDIQQDLADFRVNFDLYFSEQQLFDQGAINQGIEVLTNTGFVYEEDGALWFKSESMGDEKDRVLKRGNGVTTYFASDVAYHWHKYQRGFDILINLFGADHHGYVARVLAAAQALGFDAKAIHMLLIQFAILYRDGEKVPMSTRSGEFVTLRALFDEVGVDAARFFYVLRKTDQHMDFDMSLAVSHSNENPVYYVQYAHARIASVFRQLDQKQLSFDQSQGLAALEQLNTEHDWDLMAILERYPETLCMAARDREPHQLAYYLRELAQSLHSYYNAQPLLVDQVDTRNARLCLMAATQRVLSQGLGLLGVTAPESM